jgi:hypothetical protein
LTNIGNSLKERLEKSKKLWNPNLTPAYGTIPGTLENTIKNSANSCCVLEYVLPPMYPFLTIPEALIYESEEVLLPTYLNGKD